MKTAGIILIVLQAVALCGGITTGSFDEMLSHGGIRTAGNLVGFFMFGIIGVILLIKASGKKDRDNSDSDSSV